MSGIDLSRLPPPEFIEELSFEAVLAEMMAQLAELYPDMAEALEDLAEPATKVLETFAYREVLLRRRMNDRGRSYLLPFAKGEHLDWLGANFHRVERLEGERDEAYLRRILLGPDAVTTAGSADSYRALALNASAEVRDARVLRPTPGQVRVVVLSAQGDGAASAPLLETVLEALSAEKARPLNDSVQAVSAQILAYRVRLRLSIDRGPSPEVVRRTVRDQALEWTAERHRLQGEVLMDALRGLAYGVPGVRRAVLEELTADIVAGEHQAPYCEAVEVVID